VAALPDADFTGHLTNPFLSGRRRSAPDFGEKPPPAHRSRFRPAFALGFASRAPSKYALVHGGGQKPQPAHADLAGRIQQAIDGRWSLPSFLRLVARKNIEAAECQKNRRSGRRQIFNTAVFRFPDCRQKAYARLTRQNGSEVRKSD
jgi:hypothetical protein